MDNEESGKLVRPETRAVEGSFPYPPFRMGSTETAEPSLRDYLTILHKHRWLIVAFLLTVVTVVTIASFKMQPRYEAVARIEIEPESPDIQPLQTSPPPEAYRDMETYVETRAKVLQSETLVLDTSKKLDLENNIEFADLKEAGVNEPQARGSPKSPEHRPAIVGAFLDRLGVKRVRNSRLIEVGFQAHDPQLAARVVNTHLANFIEHNFRTRYEASRQASNWLSGQLDDLKIRVEKAEDALVSYERQNQIWMVSEKENITTQKLADLNREFTQVQADRMQKEAVYQVAQAGNIDAVPAVREGGVVQGLLERHVALRDEYVAAQKQFGPNYPKVLRLAAQLKELEELIAREKQNIIAGIESAYRTAKRREELIGRALEQQKAEASQLAEKLIQYNILKREVETNRQLYEGLLQRIKEAGVSAGLRSSNIRIVDPALVPSLPVRPRKALNMLLAIFVGLIGGVGLAFVREYLDYTVKTPADVECLTRLPALAAVPELPSTDRRPALRHLPRLLKPAREAGAPPAVELIVQESPRSHGAEAFRMLRTSLLLSQPGGPPQVILITSSLPQEGKTTAAVNLALTLAQLGDRTLLLDADLRRPGVAETLGLKKEPEVGLSNYLASAVELAEIVVAHPAISNLFVVPTGPVPPNPAELLSAERMKQALTALRNEFKFVIIDSAPVLSFADTVILSVLVDCVVLVVRSAETPKQALVQARDLLAGVNCKLLGVVLNAADFSSPDYYYGYRYYPYYYREEKEENRAAGNHKG